MTAHPEPRPDRARPWLTAAWIAALLAIVIGSALIGAAVAGVRVLQPTGTVDQGLMVQVASTSAASSLVEGGIVVAAVLLTSAGVRRAVVAPRGGRGTGALVGALVDRSVVALAIVAVLGAVTLAWSAAWEPPQPGSISYFGEPTSDDLWPVRLEYLVSAVSGAATIAAVAGCIGVLIVIGSRLRTR